MTPPPPAVEGLGSFSLGQTIAVVVIAGCVGLAGWILAARPNVEALFLALVRLLGAVHGTVGRRLGRYPRDRGSVPGVVLAAALLLGALAFAQSQASKATSPPPACDLAVQSECPTH